MKHIYSLIACLLIGTASFAQLPDGSIAPDFTATDIDGVEHNLYDLLDEGKKVIIDFSATWCGPCWSYHTSGVFEELYETYGPDGTDELRIFYIESDDTTTDDDLNGTGASTQGDWVTGTNYPIIDNGANIFDDYAGAYYPTIYTVCPNRILTESGQASAEAHASIFQANDCAAASLPNDPALLGYTGGTTACPGEPVNMSVDLMNLGVTNLQYCTIAVMEGSTEVLSYDWSGDLDTYGIANVALGSASFDASTAFTIEITSSDDNDVNNSSSGAVELAVEGTSLVKVEIQTDNWPGEISWDISDDAGNVIESVAAGEITAVDEVIVWWVSVPSEGCYSFTMGDTYGDGLLAEQWGDYTNGNCTVKTYNDDITFISSVFEYDGSYEYESVSAGMSVNTVNVGINEQSLNELTRVFPNPFAEQTNLQFSTTKAGAASIVVYNLVGEQIINDNLGTLAAGEFNHVLNFNGVTAGVYLIHLTAGGETTTMRATLK